MKKNVKRLMASGKTSTKHKGHEAVIRYEAKHHPQWKVTAVEKNGIDLIATNLRTNKQERFIEVKATGKKNFEWREFERPRKGQCGSSTTTSILCAGLVKLTNRLRRLRDLK